MSLSVPIYVLKQRARQLKRARNISHTSALDCIAREEGYASWSLLIARTKRARADIAEHIYDGLENGDVVLLGARPGQGKTLFALRLLNLGMREGLRGWLFSLDNHRFDLKGRARALGFDLARFEAQLSFEQSYDVCASHIIQQTSRCETGTMVVIDYLQLLDHKRSNPPLQAQIELLKAHTRAQGCRMVFLSQIHRDFDECLREVPSRGDVRLPNPLDLALFNKAFFLHDGNVVPHIDT